MVSIGAVPAFPASKRRLPRYKLAIPLGLTVLRSGVPDKISGSSIEVSEGGMGVVTASQLLVGESVRVEFLVPHMSSPMRATAVVRYQGDERFGLQFLRLPVAQQLKIRYWTRQEGEILLAAQPAPTPGESVTERKRPAGSQISENSNQKFRNRRFIAFAICVLVLTVLLGCWHWQRGWTELEEPAPDQAMMVKPQLKVPAETMERRILHQVTPDYPIMARQARVQGTVVLDTVVSAEGAVTRVKLISGPQALSQAAIDAVRWWRYEPYLVNGQPTIVETTVAVNFQLAN